MQFEIRGEFENIIRLIINEVHGFPDQTSYFGGYEILSIVEIKSSNYYIKGSLWVTTGNIYNFYKELTECQKAINGTARFESYEHDLEFSVEYDYLGHVNINGEFRERAWEDNLLKFSFITDQTFIKQTLNELAQIYEKYGDNEGKIK